MGSELLNLLILPLLGGYVFFSKLHWTSFAAKKMEGQRLIYCSSVIGVFLVLAARAVELGIDALDQRPDMNSLLVSAFVGLTLVAQAICGLIVGAAALAGELDRSRSSDYRPRAALVCAALLLALLAPVYARFFDIALWHFGAAGTVFFILVLLVHSVAEWVVRTSSQTAVTAIIRVALLLLSLSACTALVLIYGIGIRDWWSEFSSIRYSGIALLAATIGAIGWMPINVILTDRWGWRWAHERRQTSGLELLLYTAWIRNSTMQLSLKDGKVYVGFVAEMPAPKPNLAESCLEFTPLSSGYRKADKTVRITTDYAGVIARLRAEAAQQDKDAKATLKQALDRLSKVVPISEVSVAALYSDQYTATDLTVRPRRPRQSKAHTPANAEPTDTSTAT